MGPKWFVLVDRDGLALGPARVVTISIDIAAGLTTDVVAACPWPLARVDDLDLTVYASWSAFKDGLPFVRSAPRRTRRSSWSCRCHSASCRHYPATTDPHGVWPEATDNVLWFGLSGKMDSLRDVDLNGDATLGRCALTHEVTTRLHAAQESANDWEDGDRGVGVLPRKEPSHYGEEAYRNRVRLSDQARPSEGCNVRIAFQDQGAIEWEAFLAMAERGYTLYIVVDEAQTLYRSKLDPPTRASSDFWQLVEAVRTSAVGNINVLLFASFASRLPDSPLLPPVQIPLDHVLGIDQLNFGSP